MRYVTEHNEIRCEVVQMTQPRTYLQPHNHGIQIQNGLPVLTEDIETHVSLQVNVRVVDLLLALDLGRVVREVLVDAEIEQEAPALVDALVRLDREREVEDVVRVGHVDLHRRG